jgi:hypothetical protein
MHIRNSAMSALFFYDFFLTTEVFLDHSGFLITYRHTVRLLWTSDQPVANTSTYTGQHNI